MDLGRSETVLVIGGAGYIGSVLVGQLLSNGVNIRVLDPLLYGFDPDGPLREIMSHPNFQLIVGDCRNSDDVAVAMRGVDAVVHLGAIVGDDACRLYPKAALEINFEPIRMLAAIAQASAVKRFVFASSCSVYGEREGWADETSAVSPVSLYAETKVDAERVLLGAASDSFHPSILRLATVFGLSYRPRFDLIVNLLSAQACKDGALTIYNGDSWRPFIHVRDVAAGITSVLNAPVHRISGQIFNLGDSRLNFTFSQLAAKICEAFPHAHLTNVESTDRRNYRVSFDRIHKALGFRFLVSLEDGIAELRRGLENSPDLNYRDIRYNRYKFLQALGNPANGHAMDCKAAIRRILHVPGVGSGESPIVQTAKD